MSLRPFLLCAAATLAACSGSPPATGMGNDTAAVGSAETSAPAPSNAATAEIVVAAKTAAAYAGRWTGPEGLLFDVRAQPGGALAIDNQYTLDSRAQLSGTVTNEGIRFVRGGRELTATPTDGDGTGMKWLAGKRDCLVVIRGSEGYCRS